MIITLAQHEAIIKQLEQGALRPDEYRQAFADTLESADAFTAELNALKKADLVAQINPYSRFRTETKQNIIAEIVSETESAFTLGRSIEYAQIPGTNRHTFSQGIKNLVAATTPEFLNSYALKVSEKRLAAKAERAEVLKGIENPETKEDYQRLLKIRIDAVQPYLSEPLSFQDLRMTLNPAQRAHFDQLAATETRTARKAKEDNQRAHVPTMNAATSGEIRQTTHTKTGRALFVVVPADRVESDVYKLWNSTAKRLGGYYSSFRGVGAIPGFQFPTMGAAEAFNAFIGGDKGQASEAIKVARNAYLDDKTQTTAERLREMANALTDKAKSALNQDRKTNTHRRADAAARADSAARKDKALAETMLNIAEGLENNALIFLDKVRAKTQVELLNTFVKNAQYKQQTTLYKTYLEREQHQGEEPNTETADYIDFPNFVAYRSDLAKIARVLVNLDGSRMLGKELLKIADDTSKEYDTFAKKNLLSVSRFTIKDGAAWAEFSTKRDAETSIFSSGLSAVASVLQVKKGEYRIILSASEAIKRGIWEGDHDKKINLSYSTGVEMVEKLGRAARKNSSVSIPWQFENVYNTRKKLSALGIENPAELRAAVREFINLKAATQQEDQIKKLERSMVGRSNDGLDFFPTPTETADLMIDCADLREGLIILEPSAGWGHIAERIRAAGFEPDVCELSSSRRELLELKGFNVVTMDFMTRTPIETYDRIIMNPPFSDRRDAEHVQHAYHLLKKGGRIVALMGEGVFFGSDKKAVAFREWLESVNGSDEKLDAGTFQDSSLPVNTSVSARLVIIDKV
jgi:hypothetical protein